MCVNSLVNVFDSLFDNLSVPQTPLQPLCPVWVSLVNVVLSTLTWPCLKSRRIMLLTNVLSVYAPHVSFNLLLNVLLFIMFEVTVLR